MRFSTIALIAGSMTAAAPALAQNTADPAAANEVAPADPTAANDVSVDTNLTNDMAAPVATTEPTTPGEPAPAPAPAKRSFPWGVLGLLGLIGLLGKRNRTG